MRKSLLGAAVLGLLLSGCGIVQTTSHAHMKMGIAENAAVISSPRVRTYYIAADEVKWDYAPDDRNDIAGRPWNDDEKVFVENGPTRIGHVYRKSLYRAYTDATFTRRLAMPTSCPPGVKPCDDTLGMMGPVIRAVVGDTVKVVFRNNTLKETRGAAKRVGFRLGKDTKDITLDGNTVEGFAAKVDDKRK